MSYRLRISAVAKCKDNTITCSKTEICVNTPTGPVCECLSGYHRNDKGVCEGK